MQYIYICIYININFNNTYICRLLLQEKVRLKLKEGLNASAFENYKPYLNIIIELYEVKSHHNDYENVIKHDIKYRSYEIYKGIRKINFPENNINSWSFLLNTSVRNS